MTVNIKNASFVHRGIVICVARQITPDVSFNFPFFSFINGIDVVVAAAVVVAFVFAIFSRLNELL